MEFFAVPMAIVIVVIAGFGWAIIPPGADVGIHANVRGFDVKAPKRVALSLYAVLGVALGAGAFVLPDDLSIIVPITQVFVLGVELVAIVKGGMEW